MSCKLLLSELFVFVCGIFLVILTKINLFSIMPRFVMVFVDTKPLMCIAFNAHQACSISWY